ncbi:MAG: hypothetical protein MUF54_01945 [Polyangiaceae bacterium]|nr:hypothetical protein [Polyangiaceae bacterium]
MAIITRDDIVQRILSHINSPAAPQAIGPGGSLAWNVEHKPMDDWVLGIDSEPADVNAPQRGPPYDECVNPPAPDC